MKEGGEGGEEAVRDMPTEGGREGGEEGAAAGFREEEEGSEGAGVEADYDFGPLGGRERREGGREGGREREREGGLRNYDRGQRGIRRMR